MIWIKYIVFFACLLALYFQPDTVVVAESSEGMSDIVQVSLITTLGGIVISVISGLVVALVNRGDIKKTHGDLKKTHKEVEHVRVLINSHMEELVRLTKIVAMQAGVDKEKAAQKKRNEEE